jgi:hypothetical protein
LVIVGRDDTGLGAGDARHVAVGVGDVAEGERLGLADDAQVLVDADVGSLVAAVRTPPSRYSVWARTPKARNQMSAASSRPSAVAMAIGASVAGGAVGSSEIAVLSRSSTPRSSSWRRSASRRAWS